MIMIKEQFEEFSKRFKEIYEAENKSIVTREQRLAYLKKRAISQRPKKKKRRK